MKLKNILLALFTIMLCCQPNAQISTHAGDASATNATDAVICSWRNEYIVSWYKANNTPQLDITKPGSGTIHRVLMPLFTILDMAVLDNYLYFCGRSSSDDNSHGVLGRVNLNDIIFNSVSLSIDYTFVSNINAINKLTVYYDNNTPHVAAIGETFVTLTFTYSNYSFIDCLYNSASPTMLNINTRPFSTLERYDDIMETNNHIVCVGYYSFMMGPSFCYRKVTKSNLADAMFDTIHYYNGGNDALSTTHSTAIYSNLIAVSYLAQDSLENNVTRIRIINTADNTNTKAFEYRVPAEIDYNDIVYVPKGDALIVMQDYVLNHGRNTNFMYVYPSATSPYLSVVEYKLREYFKPLAVHDDIYYLAAAGAKWLYKDVTVLPSGYPNSGCPDYANKIVYTISTLTHIKKHHALSASSEPYNVFSMPTSTNTSTMTVECINQ